VPEYPASPLIIIPTISALTLAYSEHLGAAYRAHTLSCRLSILHGYALGIFHLPFGTAFNAICLHFPPPSWSQDKLFTPIMSIP